MSPLIIIVGLLSGAYVISKKPKSSSKSDCGCSGFKPFFKLSQDCTKVLGLSDWVLKPQLLKADNNKINAYINSHKKDFDIFVATDDILIKRYGEKCYKASEIVYNFLFMSQFTDIARVLFIYNHISNYEYDDLIFKTIHKWLEDKKLIKSYTDGGSITFLSDSLPDETWIPGLIDAFKLYPKMSEKDSFALAIPLYFGSYIQQDQNEFFVFDYEVEKSVENQNRFNRFTNIVNKAKEQFKKGNKK